MDLKLPKRLAVTLQDLDLSVLNALVETRTNFLEEKEKAKAVSKEGSQRIGKRFDKTPW